MNRRKFRTALIGLGRIGATYADDKVMANALQYVSHAQVLAKHPDFEWIAAFDNSPEAVKGVRAKYDVPLCTTSIVDIVKQRPDVLVIATPSGKRTDIVRRFEGLSAILVEKPLGGTASEASDFATACEQLSISVQVNLWRRADELTRQLQADFKSLVGRPQAAVCVYGNGILNNATHFIDLCRWFFGEVRSIGEVSTFGSDNPGDKNDPDISFFLKFDAGVSVAFLPVDFRYFRDLTLEIWGATGKLSICNSGMFTNVLKVRKHATLSGQLELAYESPQKFAPTVGLSLYRMYNNLADHLNGEDDLWSPAANALATSTVIDEIIRRTRITDKGQ